MPVRDYDGKSPSLAADAFVAPNAEVVGDVSMAEHSSVWFSSVVRANGAPVSLGVGTDVQDNSLVESVPGGPARLGSFTSLGHGATVQGSELEDHVLIAMNATVKPGCRIGRGTIVAANATVPDGTDVPPNSLVVGDPGRVMRMTTEAERDRIELTSGNYMELANRYREALGRGH